VLVSTGSKPETIQRCPVCDFPMFLAVVPIYTTTVGSQVRRAPV